MNTKPDRKHIKELIDRACAVDTGLRTASDSSRGEINALRRAAEDFYNARVRSALEELDVEMLSQSKQGIRTAYLKNAGINDIYKLSGLSRAKIEAIEGIGAQGAKKIYDTVKKIVANTKDSLRVRIDADSPTPEDDALITAIHIFSVREALRPELKNLYREHHRTLTELSAAADKAASGIKWLFSGKGKKEESLAAAQKLESFLDTVFGPESEYGRFSAVLSADVTERRAHFRENAAEYYSVLEKYCKQLNTETPESTGLSAELIAEIEAQPLDLQYLKATLRSYQTFGVKYAVHQKRTLLGDEMGLGKTVQAIAVIAALKAAGKHHFMVVCPASVLVNWCREIEKFSTLAVTKVHGNDEEALYRWRANGDVAVTTYESISRFTLPEKFTFDMLIADEAHYVKNPEAQRTVAMEKLLAKTEGVLYMSGTPLVNRVDEMCYLVKCLQPETAKKLEQVRSVATAEQFRQELSPVYLRRVREDVLKELPQLTEKEQWCELGEKEKAAYRSAVESGNLMAIRQVSWNTERLEDSSKAQRLKEIWESAMEQERKIIVFSFFRSTLDKVRTLLGEHCLDTVSGDISPARRQEIVDEFNRASPGAVLVSQVQAGGTGLNIQAASVIVFCEPQLTPAIENQAIARAYRMGQTRDVLVYRLLADDTVDERMLEILSSKQKEFDSFADESAVGTGQLEAMNAAEEGSRLTQMIKEEQARLAGKETENAGASTDKN